MDTAGPFSAVDTAGPFSAVDTAGPFSAVSLKQLKAPEERQGRLHAGPFPAVSVDS